MVALIRRLGAQRSATEQWDLNADRERFCGSVSLTPKTAMSWQGVDDVGAVKPAFLRDSPGFPIVSALAPQPSEAIFDKITMSAFEGTPLHIALRDCGITAFAIAGIALEVGIEPTIRHATDLGLIPVLIADACGSGNAEAARRSLESLAFEGNTVITHVATFTSLITQRGG